jgi:hypothetical protein
VVGYRLVDTIETAHLLQPASHGSCRVSYRSIPCNRLWRS